MTLEGKETLILTNEETETLLRASEILYNIAELMDRAVSVEWSWFNDDEIFGACEIIKSFIE